MFSLSSNFSDFGHTSPPAGHLFGAVGLLRPAIFGRCPALLPKHFEIQGLKGCRRHFQHHPAAVAHDLGGDVNHPAAQRGGMANGLDHRRAHVLLEALAEKSGLVRLALSHKFLDWLMQLAAADVADAKIFEYLEELLKNLDVAKIEGKHTQTAAAAERVSGYLDAVDDRFAFCGGRGFHIRHHTFWFFVAGYVMGSITSLYHVHSPLDGIFLRLNRSV